MRRFFTVLLVFLMSGVVWGQLASWSLTVDGAPSGVNANLTAGNFSATGVGTLNFGSSGAFAYTWSTGDIDLGKYFEITLAPNPTYEIVITEINFGERRSSTGPRDYQVRWSVDDFANSTTIATVNVPDDDSERDGSITGLEINVSEGQTLKIRWYGYNAESTAGTWRINDGTLNVVGFFVNPEPTNHVADFTAMHNGTTQVDLTWTDNDGAQAADGFLILANTTGTFTDPVDGTPQADDTDLSDNAGQVNVAHGVETYSFTGLTPETQYFFKIYPYTNSGSAIDYKVDGTVPTANATPTTLLLVENFDYAAGTLLTNNGWTAHSGAGTEAITVNDGGLTFADYPSSGIGNAALVDNNGEDINRSFAEQSSGTIYYSFLVRVDGISNDYFIHLNKSSSTFAARVFIQSASGGFNFGISNSTTGIYGSTVYSTGVTYLCIVEYDFTTEDVNLWVSSSGVPASKLDAGTPEVSTTGSGQSPLNAISLRQYSSAQNIIVDGIRVATSWAQAPLPVELTSFTANVFDSKVNLRWQTATEVDNYGFEVQRSAFSNQRPANWENIGFVAGHGNSNSPKNYEFTDSELPNCDAVSYRLKQIDIDGAYEYSNEIEVTLETIPAKFELAQNYPNPFNPVTKIQYSIPAVIAGEAKQSVNATLKVYDIIGREVAVLVNEAKEAGIYEVEFDASKLSSGLYFYSLSTSGKTITKKMMLLR